jgi:hypothetical protein
MSYFTGGSALLPFYSFTISFLSWKRIICVVVWAAMPPNVAAQMAAFQ